MDIDKIFEHNKEWVAKQLNADPAFFDKLADGQSPEVLYIGCSDSRISIRDLLNAKPGQAFIHRNIGNMINNLDLNSASVINYAINHLKVKDLIICGHTQCGAVKAAMSSADLGILNPWLRGIRDIYRLHQDELDAIEDQAVRYDRLVELNVQEQCFNAMKNEDVQRAVRAGQLTIHGWVFVLETGKIKNLEIKVDDIIAGKQDIYHLL